MKRILLFASVIALLVAGTASANMLGNASFEDNGYGTIDHSPWVNLPGPGVSGVAQAFSGGEFGWTPPNNVPSATDGTLSCAWVSGWATDRNGSYIYQQVTQPAGTMLDWSVDLYASGGSSVEIRYDPNGGTDPNTATLLATRTAQSGVWGSYSGQVMSGGTTGTVFVRNFQSFPTQNIAAVDNVVLTPEPASSLLLGLPLLLVRRRR